MAAIQVNHLRRSYRTRTGITRRTRIEVEALRDVSFEVAEGELFGLLGPNGAGKTTLIKVLITLLTPSSGSARVLGYDVVTDARTIRRRVGYVFGGDRGLYERLSGLDNLRYFAELYGVPAREQKARIQSLLELVGLAGRGRERVEGYSRGMRQRLHIARGLIHDPQVVFLDEPTMGLDPVGAREVRAMIAALPQAGKTVFLTTHYMLEADALCDRIAVITRGSIVALGRPTDLKRRVPDRTVVEIEVFGLSSHTASRIRALPGVSSVSVEDRDQIQLLRVHTAQGLEFTGAVVDQLDGGRIGRISSREPTLEDAYVSLVTEGPPPDGP